MLFTDFMEKSFFFGEIGENYVRVWNKELFKKEKAIT
jgi:hypothetical protein